MVRIAGVDLDDRKPIHVALTKIYGIGRSRAREILEKTGINPQLRTHQLSQEEVARIEQMIEQNYKVEGELR